LFSLIRGHADFLESIEARNARVVVDPGSCAVRAPSGSTIAVCILADARALHDFPGSTTTRAFRASIDSRKIGMTAINENKLYSA